MKPGEGEYAVLWSLGRFDGNQLGLMLTKGGDGNLYLQHTYKRSGSNYRFGPYTPSTNDDQTRPYCNAGAVSRGFHLVTATFDIPNQKRTLKVDDGNLIVATGTADSKDPGYLQELTDGGMQLGNAFGHIEAPLVQGLGVSFDRIMAWDSAFTDAQQTTLWNQYAAVIQNPLVPSYDSDYATQNGTIYVPDLDLTGGALHIQRGTMQLPAGAEVQAKAVKLGNWGNQGTTASFTFDLAGTLGVTSESPDYNVCDVRDTSGVLLGHWFGSGTVNVTGTLAATNAFVQTKYGSFGNLALNINGGRVTTRGLYANGSGSTINLSNGGTLELAEFHSGSAIPLTSAGGTICAVESGTYTSGWTWNGTVAVNGETTLDPNGKTIVFIGATTGAGKVVISDSATGGVVKLQNSNSFTGAIDVNAGTFDLGVSRPTGTIKFAAGAKLNILLSASDDNGRVALDIDGAGARPNVTLYASADATEPLETTITTEAGKYYINYETDTVPVSGEACWFDWEFNGDYTSIGRNTLTIGHERNFDGNFVDEKYLYTAAEIITDQTAYPTEWSAATFATVPEVNNGVLVAFGKQGSGSLAIIAGDVTKDEVILARTTGNSQYTALATMVVPNAYDTPHLYVLVKTAAAVNFYVDGELRAAYSGAVTIGNGLQTGTVHGGVGNTGYYRFEPTSLNATKSYLNYLRIYDTALSAKAIATLVKESSYDSTSATYTRRVSGVANWRFADAWAYGESQTTDASAQYGSVELEATADSVMTISEAVVLESLTVSGSGKVTFAFADGGSLVVAGKAVFDANVQIPYTETKAVNIGNIEVTNGKTLTFDYSDYELALDAPNSSLTVSGIVTGEGTVAFTAPDAANSKGRTWGAVAYDAVARTWSVPYERGAYTLYWVGTAATGNWSALDVWKKDSVNGEAAAFIEGDSVVFGNVENVGAVEVTIPQAVTVGGVTINAPNTAYTLNGTINVDGANITVASDAAITGLAGTAGTVNITGSNVTLGSSGALAIATAATVSANTALTIGGGNGTITYTGGGTTFQGTLEVKQGTLVVDCQLNRVTATEANPIKVTGTGHLFFMALTNAAGNRLAANGYIVVDGESAFLEVQGNNTFPRGGDDNLGLTTITCKNGGTMQVNGDNEYYNIHVKDVILDSGTVRLSGTVGSWGRYRGLEIDGSLVTTGESYLTRYTGAVDRLVLRNDTVVVQSGTLHWELMAQYDNIIKTGAGALVFGGSNGGTYNGNGTVTVSEGTLVANDRLKSAAKNLVFARGAVFDLSALTDAYDLSGFTSVTLNGRVKLDLGERAVASGDKVLAWTAAPSSGRFAATTASGISFAVQKRDDGAYLAVSGFSLIFR